MALAIMLTSCSKPKSSGGDFHPLRGRLLIDGKPAAGSTIKFIPINSPAAGSKIASRRIPAATVEVDGTFQASFNGIGDGAPIGTYNIVVFMLQVPDGGGLPVDRFGGKYMDESNPVATVTVTEGDNDCGTIELAGD